MDNDSHVFAELNGYYHLLTGDGEVKATGPRCTVSQFDGLADAIYSSADLSERLPAGIILPQSRFELIRDENMLVLVPRSGIRRRKSVDDAVLLASYQVSRFRLALKDLLIERLYSQTISLGDYVRAWSDYFLFDDCSLWIYNRFTHAFTSAYISFDYPADVVFESEESPLNAVLEADYETERRPPIRHSSDRRADAVVRGVPDVASVNRIKLSLGIDGTIGVLTFFSRYPNYYLLSDKISEVRNAMEAKYLQVRHQAHQQMDQINQQFIETYTAGQLVAFLESIACEVKHRFQVEACAIFLADKEKVHLNLVASCDQKNRGNPVESYTYQVDDDSETIDVYQSGNPRFSYDLTVDDPERTGYQNETEHPPRNWIGVPLKAAGECFGVLRIHNKFSVDAQGTHHLSNFTTGDFINLQALCSNLANLVRIESLFLETSQKLADTNASMTEMNDFNKVFMHEIRTPISKFTMAPEIIKRSLTSPRLDEQSLEKVIRQLDDIQLMGDRLEFITKAFNFDQIVTRRDFQILSVLRDIVYPIINITRPYLRKQYDIDIDLVTTGLSSIRVYGDKTLLNIVFNTLIDNAGKYTVDTHQSIVVEGNSLTIDDEEFFDIIVSNHGLAIHEDEVDSVFEKGVRGTEAKRRGIDGTGIGLHLAQQIMHEGEGDLLLTSSHDPVSFTIRIPRRAPQAHTDHE